MADSDSVTQTPLTMVGGFFDNDLCHVGFVAKSMSRSLKSWQASGGQVVIPPTHDPIQNVYCALVAWKSGFPVEIVSPVDPSIPSILKGRLSRGGGLDHLCFFSDDLEADIERHQSDGAVLNVAPVYGCVFDRKIAFLTHRTGLLVELMERKASGLLRDDPIEAIEALQLLRPNALSVAPDQS